MAWTVVVVAVAALGAGCGPATDQSPGVSSGTPSYGTSLDAAVPPEVLDAPLVDDRGRAVSLRSWRDKTIVLSDVMTLCQETCPLVTASMLASARQIDATPRGRDVEFVSLTIDPRRDDLRHLRAYSRQFGSIPNWAVLTGSPTVVDRLWSRLGIWRRTTRLHAPYPTDWLTGRPLTTDIAHTDELIFITGQRFRYEMEGPGNVPARRIPHRIYRFMDALGHRNARTPDAGAWTPDQVTSVLDRVLGKESS
jgi:protein SCO1/2